MLGQNVRRWLVVDWRPLSTTALQAYRERRVGIWWTARWCAAPDVLASSREASLFRLKLPEAHPELIDLSTNLVGASGRADALEVKPDRRQRGCPASRENRRCGAPPLAPALPERCLLNSSLSKTIAPGLRLGCVARPAAWLSRVDREPRRPSWALSRLCLRFACEWIEDGTAACRLAWQPEQVTQRWRLAQKLLGSHQQPPRRICG